MIRIRAWHFSRKTMFSPEEMTRDQMALLPNGQFANIDATNTMLSTIFSNDEMMPLLSTTFNDVDEKEVFQGDVVRATADADIISMDDPDPNLRVIRFDPEKGGLALFRIDGEPFGSDYTYCKTNFQKCFRVVGNVYENPELLEF